MWVSTRCVRCEKDIGNVPRQHLLDNSSELCCDSKFRTDDQFSGQRFDSRDSLLSDQRRSLAVLTARSTASPVQAESKHCGPTACCTHGGQAKQDVSLQLTTYKRFRLSFLQSTDHRTWYVRGPPEQTLASSKIYLLMPMI